MNRSDGADAPYWEALSTGKLMLPRCEKCDRWMWPAGHRCGACGSTEVRWVERAMKGTVFSWTRTWHRFGLTESFDLPFISAVVEVDDCGVRLLGRLDDPERINPKIGDHLEGWPGVTVVGDDNIPTILWSRTP
jgi:uncharacterized OB-fold protein